MPNYKYGRPISVLVNQDLEEIIRNRSATNHRSMTKEIVFLIETALAVESEDVRRTMQLLYKIGAEVIESPTPPSSSPDHSP